MNLPYSDPSNPALPSPLFSDLTAVRGDHLRANNAAIFADLEALDARNPALVALTTGSFKTAALANANTYNGRSAYSCTAGVSDLPSAAAWHVWGIWNPTDSSGRFTAMLDASLETWDIVYTGGAWGAWTKRNDANAIHTNINGEIAAITEKTAPVDDDVLVVEDSESDPVNAKKKVKFSRIVPTTPYLVNETLTPANSVDIDWSSYSKASCVLNRATTTFAFSNDPAAPTTLLLVLEQDAGGGKLATFPAAVKWSNGVATLSAGGSAIDIVNLYWDGTTYFATVMGNFKTL